MPWITSDDWIETYSKLRQRGLSFLLSKFNWRATARTRSAFDDTGFSAANWWMIPAVKRRWNELISGDPGLIYEDYFAARYLEGRSGLRILSLGSGICSHEMILAGHPAVASVRCIDLAGQLLQQAAVNARAAGIDNMIFECADLRKLNFEADACDIVFFHASLHHFAGLETLLGERLYKTLKAGGLILINEYVGPRRMQFPAEQIRAINEALRQIPQPMRRRLKSEQIKHSVSGPGLLRMWLADPSECVESDRILPLLHQHYRVLEEKPYGGNLLMLLLKDIAHHFMQPGAAPILRELFALEDAYLQDHPSDFLFGVYQKPQA